MAYAILFYFTPSLSQHLLERKTSTIKGNAPVFLTIKSFQAIKQKKESDDFTIALFQLDYQDSNLEKQDQNLLCYHYTIVQFFNRTTRSVFDDAKIRLFIHPPNFLQTFFIKKAFFLVFTLKKLKKHRDFASFFLWIQENKYLCISFIT